MSRFFCVEIPPNIKVHSATSYLIFQYLQYWYYQYFPVSAILVLPVFSRIFQYLQYSYFGNDQYLLVLQILENSERYWDTSIYQYLYQYCRYWKILVNTGITSIVIPVSRPADSYYPNFLFVSGYILYESQKNSYIFQNGRAWRCRNKIKMLLTENNIL